MARVLIIDQDRMIAAIERDFLETNGFDVAVAMTGKEGMKLFDGGDIEAVILDVDLSDTDGFLLCRKLRAVSNVPILFITARDSLEDKVKGLGLGADDYIVKPFNPSEMIARLKAHLDIHERLLGSQRTEADNSKPDIQIGDLRIFVKRHQVFRGSREISLTGKEFNLLLFLARHPNQVFSKKYLFEMIWHLDALGELATVTVHVNRLRDKLNEVEPPFTAIETVWENGYRFRVEE